MPLPLPPLEMRRLVGPFHPDAWENPSGQPVYPELPAEAYDAVFDFGCGCGRIARQLLQQTPRPHRYVGIDVNRHMVEWCVQNLEPVASGFRFVHHDVYSPMYADGNSYRAAAPFPVEDGEFSLLIAVSVFTHLVERQAEYYLHEVARILRPTGIAHTSWFFFDRASFPFLSKGPYSLYTSDVNPSQAVLYDRQWFLETVRRCGLRVRDTWYPTVAGHQWSVRLERREPGAVDHFPMGEEGAEWLCGATQQRIADATITPSEREVWNIVGDAGVGSENVRMGRPEPPALSGLLAQMAAMKQSWSWRIGRAITGPPRVLRRLLSRSARL